MTEVEVPLDYSTRQYFIARENGRSIAELPQRVALSGGHDRRIAARRAQCEDDSATRDPTRRHPRARKGGGPHRHHRGGDTSWARLVADCATAGIHGL